MRRIAVGGGCGVVPGEFSHGMADLVRYGNLNRDIEQKLNEDERGRDDLMVRELAKSQKWMRCPQCKYYVEKREGCLHMTSRILTTCNLRVLDLTLATFILRFTEEPKVNPLKGVRLGWRGTKELLSGRRKIWKKRTCVIFLLKESKQREIFAEYLDVKAKRWSSGKEGNLRALVSTLQYILGPESGWQPIPLTKVITSAAVKKAYRKATLCVHPDKLQQRGASIQHKYICEKVLYRCRMNGKNSSLWDNPLLSVFFLVLRTMVGFFMHDMG